MSAVDSAPKLPACPHEARRDPRACVRCLRIWAKAVAAATPIPKKFISRERAGDPEPSAPPEVLVSALRARLRPFDPLPAPARRAAVEWVRAETARGVTLSAMTRASGIGQGALAAWLRRAAPSRFR